MKSNIKKIWLSSLLFMISRPITLLPFLAIAFLEALALEFIYFAPRKPVSIIAGPLIRKFFGEAPMHYPFNFNIFPELFYGAQVAIHALAGAFLMGLAVNMFRNLKEGLPVKSKALVRNALKRYMAFFAYGVAAVLLILLLKKFGVYAVPKAVRLLSRFLPLGAMKIMPIVFSVVMFTLDIVIQAFIILTIPIIVLEKKSFIRSLLGSACLAAKNFGAIFSMIFFPFFLYLPISMLKWFSPQLSLRMFPELPLLISGAGIIAALFLDCFVLMAASTWLMEKNK